MVGVASECFHSRSIIIVYLVVVSIKSDPDNLSIRVDLSEIGKWNWGDREKWGFVLHMNLTDVLNRVIAGVSFTRDKNRLLR